MKVKICGITRAEDAELACRLGAWAVGFIFAPSPRALTPGRAARLRRALTPGVKAVGVFAGAPRDEILALVEKCRLDAVQLHGSEGPTDCAGFPVPVIKALAVSGPLDEGVLKGYNVFGFLIEPPRVGRREGDQAACWAAAHDCGRRVILAGGLDSGNVAQAVAAAKPYAVDVSSGVESSPGIKDPLKLKAFFDALK